MIRSRHPNQGPIKTASTLSGRTFEFRQKRSDGLPAPAVPTHWLQLNLPRFDELDDIVGDTLPGFPNSTSFASYGLQQTINIYQPSFHFMLYPFDRQAVTINFDTSSVNISNCGETSFFDPSSLPSDLLRGGSEYELDDSKTITSHSGVDRAGGSVCVVTIPIVRKFVSYLIKV